MNLLVERVEVWAASIEDKPGSLANILSALREAGADLNFILARRAPEAPNRSEVFVTPLRGDAELEAATTLGFNLTGSVRAVQRQPPGALADRDQAGEQAGQTILVDLEPTEEALQALIV